MAFKNLNRLILSTIPKNSHRTIKKKIVYIYVNKYGINVQVGAISGGD